MTTPRPGRQTEQDAFNEGVRSGRAAVRKEILSYLQKMIDAGHEQAGLLVEIKHHLLWKPEQLLGATSADAAPISDVVDGWKAQLGPPPQQ